MGMKFTQVAAAVALILTSLMASGAPCANYQADRQLFFGDLHVHTKYSLDASTQGTRASPADAYRFAQGQVLELPPWDDEGRGLRQLRLPRPLDFAAVTDHAELFGETEICQTPSLAGYGSWQCKLYRHFPRAAFFLFNTRASMGSHMGFCGEGDGLCLEASQRPWQEMQAAAAAANDPSDDCQFTTFVAYEWTGASSNLANTHRNVIFRNEAVPERPLSFLSAADASALWHGLEEQCLDSKDECDVLVIPHNANLSDGYMFQTVADNGNILGPDEARLRARLERLAEIMQHKGSSECAYNPLASEDELCAFEQLPYDRFVGKFVPWLAKAPSEKAGYLRSVLGEGLQLRERLGVNPYQFGFIGSTDTHIAAAGAVSEWGFPGHGGAGVPASSASPDRLPDDLEFNPGGLAAVWAEENRRDAIFDALQRREAYATSGPRIALRVFAGGLPEDMCESGDFARQGYSQGVPMGGVLTAGDVNESGITLAVLAAKAPGTPGQPKQALQRLQIIKGTLDAAGQVQEVVIDIAGDANNGASVSLSNCETHGSGLSQVCQQWRDPDFDASRPAYYYVRALENPSCRWSHRVCLAAAVNCNQPDTVPEALQGCCSDQHRPIIQERAWSSPIWYEPSQQPVAAPQ